MPTSTKSYKTSKIKVSHYFGASTKIAEHTIMKEHGNMAKWMYFKVCIKIWFKTIKMHDFVDASKITWGQ